MATRATPCTFIADGTLLEVAINGKGAFRRFKDVLLNYPEERERWFKFRDDRMEKRAVEWLESIDVSLAEE